MASEYEITILPNGIAVRAQSNELLSDVLLNAGIPLTTPCGGNGTCGKCVVLVAEPEQKPRTVLACITRIESGCTVTIPETSTYRELGEQAARFQNDAPLPSAIAIAFDVGTTSVAVAALDSASGAVVRTRSKTNGQTRFGYDVISRIEHEIKMGTGDELTAALRHTLAALIADVLDGDAPHVERIVIAANTPMTHFIFGVPTTSLASIPFTPQFTESKTFAASQLGLPLEGDPQVESVPLVGGFVGGDAVAAAYAVGLFERKSPALLIDIGTNGEVVLFDGNEIAACSAPAGPAFEGAHIHSGMRAEPGAITHIEIDTGIRCETIGAIAPRGIAGTGLIDAVAELIRIGAVNEYGAMNAPHELPDTIPHAVRARFHPSDEHGTYVRLHDNVILTQKDIRELQLAKGTIAACVKLLLDNSSIALDELHDVYIAGTFGESIRPESATRIGLIPPIANELVHFVGNASLAGACLAAADESVLERMKTLAARMRHVEFAGTDAFQTAFANAMLFGWQFT